MDAAKDATERAERIRALNERAVEAARRAGELYLDAYEKTLQNMVEQQERLAEKTPMDWAQGMIEAQAEYTRQMAKFYESAAEAAKK
jgi:diphthamide biosynthesis methyltransferase